MPNHPPGGLWAGCPIAVREAEPIEDEYGRYAMRLGWSLAVSPVAISSPWRPYPPSGSRQPGEPVRAPAATRNPM